MYWLGNQCFEITSRRENVVSNAYYWNMNVVTQSWLTYVPFAVSFETISILWDMFMAKVSNQADYAAEKQPYQSNHTFQDELSLIIVFNTYYSIIFQ